MTRSKRTRFMLAAGLLAIVAGTGCSSLWGSRSPLPSNAGAQWPNESERRGLVYLQDLSDWIEAGNRLDLGLPHEPHGVIDVFIPSATDYCHARFCRDFPSARGCEVN